MRNHSRFRLDDIRVTPTSLWPPSLKLRRPWNYAVPTCAREGTQRGWKVRARWFTGSLWDISCHQLHGLLVDSFVTYSRGTNIGHDCSSKRIYIINAAELVASMLTKNWLCMHLCVGVRTGQDSGYRTHCYRHCFSTARKASKIASDSIQTLRNSRLLKNDIVVATDSAGYRSRVLTPIEPHCWTASLSYVEGFWAVQTDEFNATVADVLGVALYSYLVASLLSSCTDTEKKKP